MEDAAHLTVEFMRRSLVLQASILDWDTFDPFSVHEDFWTSSAVDVSQREIVQTLVKTAMIIALDEGGDFGFEIIGKIVILQQDTVF